MKEFTVVAFYRTGRFVKKWNRVELVFIEENKEDALAYMEYLMRNNYPDNLWFIAQVIEEEVKE